MLQVAKKGGNVRKFLAPEKGEPARDALQLAPHSAWLDMISRAQAAFESADAREETCTFDALLDVNAPALVLSRFAHNAGVFDGASRVGESVRRMMFNRPKFVRAFPQAVAPHGFHMFSDLVAFIPESKGGPHARLHLRTRGISW